MSDLVTIAKTLEGRRSKFDVIASILDITKYGAGKGEIMLRANLNSKIARIYLQKLIARGLLTVENGEKNRKFYRTTLKGIKFLEYYRMLLAMIEEVTEF